MISVPWYICLWTGCERGELDEEEENWRIEAHWGGMDKSSIILQPPKCTFFIMWLMFMSHVGSLVCRWGTASILCISNSNTLQCATCCWSPTCKMDKAMDKEKYEAFHDALDAAMTKLDEYYTKMAASDAHIIAMGMWSPHFAFHSLIWPHSFTPWKEDVALQEVLE